ncbi:chymotrypsin-like protease CTRL-1 [Hermetia illucens]|uniref:chymotrypsin-like protease CTRL-1 n=1 Tax=Hermetia illucens TaxID=343691 RepID=UPI0018CC4942|nr:chymotrypsin-like protease CTRL-1 [Hermetia illucens]
MYNFWLTLFILFHEVCWSNTLDDMSTRMVNGTKVALGVFPFVVVIEDQSGFPLCSGSLISPGHVLSAAHCFLSNLAGVFYVVAGDIVPARKPQDKAPSSKQILRVAKRMSR